MIAPSLSFGHRALLNIAFVAIALYALLGLSFDDLGSKCLQVASLIGWLDLLFGRRRVLRSWPFYLLWAALLVQLASWAVSSVQVPDLAESSPKLHRMGSWFQFIPVAWILLGDQRKVAVVLVSSALGLCLAPWLSGGGWAEIQQGISGVRVDFGLSNAQHTAMYYACGLLAVLTVGGALHQGEGWQRVAGWVMRVSLGLAFLFGVMASQTRGIWLALAITLVVLAFDMCRVIAVNKSQRWVMALGLMACMVLAVVALSESRFASRLSTSVVQLTNPDLELKSFGASQDQSAALRVMLWHEGWQWIAQKPWLGWGGSGRKHASISADLPPQWQSIQHLHSSYIDTLVCYGMAGFVVLLLWLVWFVRAFQSSAGAQVPRPWRRLAIAWLLLWAVANAFESYWYFASGTYIVALLGGVLVTQLWRSQGRF